MEYPDNKFKKGDKVRTVSGGHIITGTIKDTADKYYGVMVDPVCYPYTEGSYIARYEHTLFPEVQYIEDGPVTYA